MNMHAFLEEATFETFWRHLYCVRHLFIHTIFIGIVIFPDWILYSL